MARTSEETLSTSWGRPCSLARYISPSNSSRTGQKSPSKASRLESICMSPNAKDATQLSNGGLTTDVNGCPEPLEGSGRIRQGQSCGSAIRRHENRQAETCEMVQRLIEPDQRPEPGVLVLLRNAEPRGAESLGAVDRDVNREINQGDKPEPRRDDQN